MITIIIIIILFVQKTKNAAMQTKDMDVEQDTRLRQALTMALTPIIVFLLLIVKLCFYVCIF